MKILVTGGTGLVGQRLGKALVRNGHEVVVLSRRREKAQMQLSYPATVVEGDLGKGVVPELQSHGIDAVFHLMGESVAAGRWSSARKNEIRQSRIQSSENLWKSFPQNPPSVLIAASAIGFYGSCGENILTEKNPVGKDFLAAVCADWESRILRPEHHGHTGSETVRKVCLRLGVVLAEEGGALEKMRPIFQNGVGGALANGQAWMSWIHIDDLVRMLIWSLHNSAVEGVLNAVSPTPVRNLEFSQALAQGLNVRLGPAVPKIALQALYGEMSQVVLASQKVLPERAQALGFQYEHPDLRQTLKEFCSEYQNHQQVFIAEQYLPFPKEQIFPFFAAAKNLEKITPPLLNFHVQSMSTDSIQVGTLIQYQLKIHGVPARWTTRIEDWRPPMQFVDLQLKGPYRSWHHTHSFIDLGSGTLMRDRVCYQLPLGILGQLVAGRFVRGDVEKIFSFRRQYLADLIKKGVAAFSL